MQGRLPVRKWAYHSLLNSKKKKELCKNYKGRKGTNYLDQLLLLKSMMLVYQVIYANTYSSGTSVVRIVNCTVIGPESYFTRGNLHQESKSSQNT